MTIDAAIIKLQKLSKLTSSKEACEMGIQALRAQQKPQLDAAINGWEAEFVDGRAYGLAEAAVMFSHGGSGHVRALTKDEMLIMVAAMNADRDGAA